MGVKEVQTLNTFLRDAVLNESRKTSLPTQLGHPQWWKGRLSALLPLRGTSGRAQIAPFPWAELGRQLKVVLLLASLSLFGYYFVSRHVATSVVVQGRSMLPTLQDGDRFILNRWSYYRRRPERGALDVVKDPGHNDFAVKRVIGLPCDALHFKNGEVLVNGKHLLEPYLAPGTQTFLPDTSEKLVILGTDQYFLLGDNRANSEDSRYYGPVRRSQIIGSIYK